MYEVEWHNLDLKEVTSLKLRNAWSQPNTWIVVSCHGIMANGDTVRVMLPSDHFKKGADTESVIPSLLDYARMEHVHLEGLGFMKEGVIRYDG